MRISGFDEPYKVDERGRRIKRKEEEEISEEYISRRMEEYRNKIERVNIDHEYVKKVAKIIERL